jgi:ATP-binding cassette subfamily F protein uup
MSEATAREAPTASPSTPPAEPSRPRENATGKRKLSYKEQREFEALPAQIAALEEEQAQLERALADGQLYANDPARAAEMASRLMVVEESWMAAMERLQALEQPAA